MLRIQRLLTTGVVASFLIAFAAMPVNAQPTTTPAVSVPACGWMLTASGSATSTSFAVTGSTATYMPIGNATMLMLLPGPKDPDSTSGTITVSDLTGPGTYDVGEAMGPNASGAVFSIDGGAGNQFGIGTSSGRSGMPPPSKLTIIAAGPGGLVGKLKGDFYVNAPGPLGPSMGTWIPVEVEFWAFSMGGCP